jgi:prepilin-type N-terminal cleavage/methylation domain-containing protein
MRATQPQLGFTLVELLVTLAITSILLLASATYLNDWTYNRQLKDAKSKLLSSFVQARAMALRNPNAVRGDALIAAGVRLDTGVSNSTLFICAGDPVDTTGCAAGGRSLLSSVNFPATIALTLRLSGNNVNSILLNRSGLPTTPNQVYGYTLSLGGSANDVSGTLL